METLRTYKRSIALMTGISAALTAGIIVAATQVLASGSHHETPTELPLMSDAGGFTTIYKDPNGPSPGDEKSARRGIVEVTSGVFIDPDKGYDI
jgi:hypothetical protein